MRVAILGSAAVAAALAAAVYVSGRPGSLLKRMQTAGVARVGYAHEAPFAYRDGTGRVTGEAPEIARVILGRLGVRRIEWVQTEFRALIPDLVAGRFDMTASGMFVTPERERQIAFSVPTYIARAALLVRRGDEQRLGSYDRVRDAGARIAIIDGAYERTIAEAAGIARDRVVLVPDAVTGIAALRSSGADALALSSISVNHLASMIADSSVTAIILPDSVIHGVRATGRGAFGFRHENRRLRAAFDAELRRFLGSPEHVALVNRFGFSPEGAAARRIGQ